MASANSNYTDIITASIEKRSRKIADNVEKNNPLLAWLRERGNIRKFSGGHKIIEEISFAENGNFGWYSGYDVLPTAAQDTISAAEFQIKQCAVPVTISGLEMLQNAGPEQMFDLMGARLKVAETTMKNNINVALYSDGTGNGGKEIVGLDLAVPADPTTGTYGGINRATYTFWRSQMLDPSSTPTASTIQGHMNTLWASCTQGANMPDLIIAGGTIWSTFTSSMQALQRFADPSKAKLGFPTMQYMTADVVLGGGIGGAADATTMYFLNTNFLHFRPHAERDMVALPGGNRRATNQDAEVAILAWAGALTSSGARYHGRLIGS